MKRKLTGILLCMMLFCTSVFTGCSLVTKDMSKYYKTEVVKIELKDKTGGKNDTMIINKKDLITAFNSYGYYYVQYQGMTTEKALEETINLLVRRKITIAQAEEMYPQLSEAEKTYLWTETYEALESNFKSYLDSILGKDNQTDSSSDEALKFNGYKKTASLLTNTDAEGKESFIIKKEDVPSKVIDDFRYETPRDYNAEDGKDKLLIYTNFEQMVREMKSDAYTKAYNDYYKALVRSEEGQNLTEDRKSVFAREIDRLYIVVYENYMIEKYQEYYTTDDNNNSNITAQQIVDLYSSKVRSSYTKYKVENSSSYDSDMQSGAQNIYYYKTDDQSTKFFNVAHILFKFNDAQSAEYKRLKERFEQGGLSEQEYDAELEKLYAQITPVVRQADNDGVYNEVDESKKQDYEKSSLALRNHIAARVGQEKDAYAKADVFNELIYKYNEDPGMLNSSYCYTIGVDKDGKAVTKYVEEFTDAAIELYNNGYGEIGDISNLVYTENGIHVLFYAGQVENLLPNVEYSSDFKLEESQIKDLHTTRVNILVDKTLFDVMYDELVVDNYAVFENLQMGEIRDNYNVHVFTNAYKDLL